MIIESGVIIFLGLLFLAWKMPKRLVLRILAWPATVDVAVSALVYILHWGTFTGVMAAACAGMMTSVATSLARWAIGYTDRKGYHPGKFVVKEMV